MLRKLFKKTKSVLTTVSEYFSICVRDLKNKIQYGKSAPLYMERIWVDPREIDTIIYREEVKAVTGIHRSKASGCVVDWKKIKGEKPLMEEFRVQYCFKHWKEGMEWDEIGVYDYMSNTKMYGNWPREKITARFKMLDKAYEEAKKLVG